jgi:hypothetical protein
MARFGEGEAVMYTTILLAAALQNWDRYSTHALAARGIVPEYLFFEELELTITGR